MIERDPITKTKTINRQYFHAAVEEEFQGLLESLVSGDTEARRQFLRRMDAMAGLPVDPLRYFYFSYGSNLRDAECRGTARDAQAYCVAFLPGYRLRFTKHSTTRGGDAATIRPDPTSMVWGYVYRVSDEDQQELKKREGGYEQIPEVTVYLLSPNPEDYPTPLTAFTFAASSDCPQRCGPPAAYLDIMIEGAEERKLPPGYRQTLVELRKALSNERKGGTLTKGGRP